METQLLHSIAAALAAAGVGVWSPTAALRKADVGIFDGPVSGNVEAVGLLLYPVDDPIGGDSTIGLQVTFRSATRAAARDRAERVFDTMHGAWGWTPAGGPRITLAARTFSADLGTDEAGAYRRSDNYYLTINRTPKE